MTRSLQEYTRVFRSAADRVYAVFIGKQSDVGDISSRKTEFEYVADVISSETTIRISSAERYETFRIFGFSNDGRRKRYRVGIDFGFVRIFDSFTR